MPLSRVFLALGAMLIIAPALAAGRFGFDTTPGRLSKDVIPSHYQLEFDLDPARETFGGRAEIEIEVRRPVDAIVVNAFRLTANSAQLVDAEGRQRDLAIEADAERMQWRLTPRGAAADAGRSAIGAGRYRVRFDYEGVVQATGQGLYRVDYTAQGERAQMLATQLEPVHARSLFPGFDEPAFRATFEISATVPARYEAVSNMPVDREIVLPNERRETHFARTPVMPTYLVAIAVGGFDSLEDKVDDVRLRILTARGKREQARYALDVTKQLLRYYRDYFGVGYMLPKLDQLAIPGVRGGAMEDWGAISYNENLLLFDPQRSGPNQQRTVLSIVAHEIAHQWFGNLVTTAWWDDIWLNEAFATWMAAKVSTELNPAWHLAIDDRLYRERALGRDGDEATRVMTRPPAQEQAIFDVFDEITYEKGGAVLGMFEQYLGPQVFRDGLRRYLATHRYSNATAADLWFHLSQASGRDLTPMIESWINQPGFPLLTVVSRCDGSRTRIEISQHRFMRTSAPLANVTWQVPVLLRAGTSTRRIVLGGEPQKLEIAGCAPVIANADDLGYYRVQYDKANQASLRAAYARLPALERYGLVADALALARAGRIGFVEYLELLPRLGGENESAIWQQVITGFEFLDQAFHASPTQARLRAYARSVLVPVLARIEWMPRSGDDASTLRLRDNLIEALGRFDDGSTIELARKLFATAAARAGDPAPIPNSIRKGVIFTATRHADDATFELVRGWLRSATSQEDDY